MSSSQKIFGETFGFVFFNKKKYTKNSGTVDLNMYKHIFVCKPDKILTVEAKIHGFKQYNVNGYGIDLKFNLTTCKFTVSVRYSCVSFLDEEKYKNNILGQNDLKQQPQRNADSVLGQNVCYDYNETVLEGGKLCYEGKMYVIVSIFCSNDALV